MLAEVERAIERVAGKTKELLRTWEYTADGMLAEFYKK